MEKQTHGAPALAVVMACAIVFNGCAAILKGKTASIPVKSSPDGAEIYLNGNRMGQTPTTIKVSAKQKHALELRKEGYETAKVNLGTHVQGGWIFLDLISGAIPVIVDAVTGSWKSLNDKKVEATLQKK